MRLRERASHFLNSEKRLTRIFSRLIALTCAGLIAASVVPTIADELSNSPEPVAVTPSPEPAPSIEPSASPAESTTPEPSASSTVEPAFARPSITVSSPSPALESTESATVVEEPPAPLADQPRYTLRIPSSQAVDPRARHYVLPHIYAQTEDPGTPTLACISGSGISLDVMQKKSAQTDIEGPDFIAGDRSSQILIAGPAARVMNIINSYAGLVLYSDSAGIAGRSVFFQFVALNKPILEPAFCGASRSNAALTLRSLSLAQSTVKGGGTLK